MVINITRANTGGPATFEAPELPAGVTMHAQEIPGNVNNFPVVFEAAPDAPIAGRLMDLRIKSKDNPSLTGAFYQNLDFVIANPNQTVYYRRVVDRMAAAVVEEEPEPNAEGDIVIETEEEPAPAAKGVRAVAKAKTSGPSASVRWNDAVESCLTKCNGNKLKAVAMANKLNPGLRQASARSDRRADDRRLQGREARASLGTRQAAFGHVENRASDALGGRRAKRCGFGDLIPAEVIRSDRPLMAMVQEETKA